MSSSQKSSRPTTGRGTVTPTKRTSQPAKSTANPTSYMLLPAYAYGPQRDSKAAYYKPRSYCKTLESSILQMEERLRTLGVDVPRMQRVGSSDGVTGPSAAALISDMEEEVESLQVEIEELEQDHHVLTSPQYPQPLYGRAPPSMPQTCYSYPSSNRFLSAEYSRMG